MSAFDTDSVTIIRKTGNRYEEDEINTAPVFPGSDREGERERIRTGVIARLRKDPTVILVLENRGGKAEERIRLRDGFEMAVSLVDGESSSATITVTREGETVLEEEFTQDPDNHHGCTVLDDLSREIITILDSIDKKNYTFLSNRGRRHARLNSTADKVDINRAEKILEEEGFQTERVYHVGHQLRSPLLFVLENEVILLGSRLFDGETLYLERKRLYKWLDRAVVARAVEQVRLHCRPVQVFDCEDGSWSFRCDLDPNTDSENFLENLNFAIAQLGNAISIVEKCEGVGGGDATMRELEQLFSYEVIDSSVKLNRLNL